ncbi:hypothetical protein K227x_07340 [Rubripirellula lacrimiformis]|uniref:Uncharacterized protein n=1 Tax=Rubripirellula lacrimiformis TaxID=1930273 RepID=A0A517N5Q0_9BACT|nr:hypothetical protein K227x_07340 [Rubripirellula lacrimiformis]
MKSNGWTKLSNERSLSVAIQVISPPPRSGLRGERVRERGKKETTLIERSLLSHHCTRVVARFAAAMDQLTFSRGLPDSTTNDFRWNVLPPGFSTSSTTM